MDTPGSRESAFAASALTITLSSLAGILLLATAGLVLFVYVRRRRQLSYESIEEELRKLEARLEDWREQTKAHGEEVRRSWHGEYAALEQFTKELEGVKRPGASRWKRRSDPVLASTLASEKEMVTVKVFKGWNSEESAPVTRRSLSAMRRPLRPKRVEIVDDKDVGSRLSVVALRSPLNRMSILTDERIKPFTAAENDIPLVEEHVPLSPPPAVVVIEEETRFPALRPESSAYDSDEDISAPIPMPNLLLQRLERSPMMAGSPRPSVESVRIDEFDLEFPLPATPTSPPLFPPPPVPTSEDPAAFLESDNEQDMHVSKRDSQQSEPVSLTTDDGVATDKEDWEDHGEVDEGILIQVNGKALHDVDTEQGGLGGLISDE